jgi:hypothetical protein
VALLTNDLDALQAHQRLEHLISLDESEGASSFGSHLKLKRLRLILGDLIGSSVARVR